MTREDEELNEAQVFKLLQKVIDRQHVILSEQAQQLPQLIALNKRLTGVDPLTGEVRSSLKPVVSVEHSLPSEEVEAKSPLRGLLLLARKHLATAQQVDVLVTAFAENPKPDTADIEGLAARTLLSTEMVASYFLHRRNDLLDDKRVSNAVLHTGSTYPSFTAQATPPLQPRKLIKSELNGHTKQKSDLSSVRKPGPSKQPTTPKAVNLLPPPPLDPSSPLEQNLELLVDEDGCLQSPIVVPRFIEVMKAEKSLEGRCLLATVLQTTTAAMRAAKASATSSVGQSLQRFIDLDGLLILNHWLMETKRIEKKDALKLLLKSLKYMPVNASALTASSIGKTVNKLRKDTDKDLSDRASQVYTVWTEQLQSKGQIAEASDKKRKGIEVTTVPTDTKVEAETDGNGQRIVKKTKREEVDDPFLSALSSSVSSSRQTATVLGGPRGKYRDDAKKMIRVEDGMDVDLGTPMSKPMSVDDIRKAKERDRIRRLADPDSAKLPPKPLFSPRHITHAQNRVSILPIPSGHISCEAVTTSDASHDNGQLNLSMDTVLSRQISLPDFKTFLGSPIKREPSPISTEAPGTKKKRVSWPAEETMLNRIRLFRSTDEPNAKPILPSDVGGSIVEKIQHASFEKARSIERSREKEALKHKENPAEEEDDEEFKKRLANMREQIDWHTPQVFEVPEDSRLKYGGESEELAKVTEKNIRVPEAIYAQRSEIPGDPWDPEELEDFYDDSQVPRVNVDEDGAKTDSTPSSNQNQFASLLGQLATNLGGSLSAVAPSNQPYVPSLPPTQNLYGNGQPAATAAASLPPVLNAASLSALLAASQNNPALQATIKQLAATALAGQAKQNVAASPYQPYNQAPFNLMNSSFSAPAPAFPAAANPVMAMLGSLMQSQMPQQFLQPQPQSFAPSNPSYSPNVSSFCPAFHSSSGCSRGVDCPYGYHDYRYPGVIPPLDHSASRPSQHSTFSSVHTTGNPMHSHASSHGSNYMGGKRNHRDSQSRGHW